MSITSKKWLSVVGIGEDGAAGLGDEARRLIGQAEIVFGGKRHLALADGLIKGEARAWPSPFDTAMREVMELRGKNVCVLASGDPFLHGVGVTLARHVSVDEMTITPSPSAFSLAASRLGWALQDVETVSLHGHAINLIRPLLHPKRRVLALTSDGDGPAAVAALLTSLGFGGSKLTVLEALGGPDERIRRATAQAFDLKDINQLNVLAAEIESDREARVLPLTSGRADDLFEHDGQITKREVRAVTLAALAPRRGELLWDIGAGSGSIAIEWMLADPSMRAIAFEADAERCRPYSQERDRPRRAGPDDCRGNRAGFSCRIADARCHLCRRRRHRRRRDGRGDCVAANRRQAGGERSDAGDGGLAAGEACGARRRTGPHRHIQGDGDRLDERLAAGHAGHAMELGEAVIVAGIGSRKGVTAAEVVAAVEAALKEYGLERNALATLATTGFKSGETGIFEAGKMMGLEVVVIETPPPLPLATRREGDHVGASAMTSKVEAQDTQVPSPLWGGVRGGVHRRRTQHRLSPACQHLLRVNGEKRAKLERSPSKSPA